jgi:uncharacterized membrane protein
MGKRAFLAKLLQDIRASYWFLPSVLVVAGLILAGATDWVDCNVDLLPFNLPDTFIDTQADGARSTLAVIAQSIIGVTGVMFSMTIVAVSFASGNFGPRLIGNFMRDRGNQWSLGILIATFVYAIVVLRSVQDGFDGGVDQFVPQYSLLVAIGLTLVCVFTMIYFVHHVPETINVSRISADLGHRLECQIRDLIDDQVEEEDESAWPQDDPVCRISARTSGYIQTCNFDQLKELAAEDCWHVEMRVAIGDFVTTATEVLVIWAKDDLTDNQVQNLIGGFAVGSGRTENQNPGFVAQQLVEMVARALSPGINDPYTAMDCINRLTAVLTVASVYKGGLNPRQSTRLRYPQLDFPGLFAVSFPLCRQYVRPDDITRQHALRVLRQLKDVVNSRYKSVIMDEIDQLSQD